MRKKNLTDKRMTDSRGKVMTFFFGDNLEIIDNYFRNIFFFVIWEKNLFFHEFQWVPTESLIFFLRWMHFWKRMRCVLKKNLHTFLESSIDRVEKKKLHVNK